MDNVFDSSQAKELSHLSACSVAQESAHRALAISLRTKLVEADFGIIERVTESSRETRFVRERDRLSDNSKDFPSRDLQ